jgi:hypothetical protein
VTEFSGAKGGLHIAPQNILVFHQESERCLFCWVGSYTLEVKSIYLKALSTSLCLSSLEAALEESCDKSEVFVNRKGRNLCLQMELGTSSYFHS